MSHDPYAAMRWNPQTDEGLSFDEQYRAAHLPHVSPDHSLTINHWDGHDYRYGRYERARVSIVADLGSPFLAQDACRSLLQALVASSFAGKVAFDLLERRAPNLHCTLVGDVNPANTLRDTANQVLRETAPLAPVVHGPFIGQFNRGRIYLPLEFDRTFDQKALDALSSVLGRDRPIFTAVGLVNLRDELDPREARELAGLLHELRDIRTRLEITELAWTSTHDDLTLDMQRLATITLTPRSPHD